MRYLILTYFRKADGKLEEAMTVARNVKKNDLQTANVILDFKKLEVVKASMGGVNVPRDFHRIVEYYYQHYQNVMDRLFRENGYEIVKNERPLEPTQNEEQNNSN